MSTEHKKKHETHTLKGLGYGLAGNFVGGLTGAAAGGVVGGVAGGVASGVASGLAHAKANRNLSQALVALGVLGGGAVGQVTGSGLAMKELTRDAADKKRFSARHPYIAGIVGPYSHAYVGHTLEDKHASQKDFSMSTNKPLSEQMKTAGIATGAAGGAIATAVVENFLRKNPHLLDTFGEGMTKKIPKGLAGLGAVAGGGAEYMAKQRRENG